MTPTELAAVAHFLHKLNEATTETTVGLRSSQDTTEIRLTIGSNNRTGLRLERDGDTWTVEADY